MTEDIYKQFEEDLKVWGLPIGIRRDVLEALVDLNNRVKELEERMNNVR